MKQTISVTALLLTIFFVGGLAEDPRDTLRGSVKSKSKTPTDDERDLQQTCVCTIKCIQPASNGDDCNIEESVCERPDGSSCSLDPPGQDTSGPTPAPLDPCVDALLADGRTSTATFDEDSIIPDLPYAFNAYVATNGAGGAADDFEFCYVIADTNFDITGLTTHEVSNADGETYTMPLDNPTNPCVTAPNLFVIGLVNCPTLLGYTVTIVNGTESSSAPISADADGEPSSFSPTVAPPPTPPPVEPEEQDFVCMPSFGYVEQTIEGVTVTLVEFGSDYIAIVDAREPITYFISDANLGEAATGTTTGPGTFTLDSSPGENLFECPQRFFLTIKYSDGSMFSAFFD